MAIRVNPPDPIYDYTLQRGLVPETCSESSFQAISDRGFYNLQRSWGRDPLEDSQRLDSTHRSRRLFAYKMLGDTVERGG